VSYFRKYNTKRGKHFLLAVYRGQDCCRAYGSMPFLCVCNTQCKLDWEVCRYVMSVDL
jgi:hypothetical protein